MSYLIADAAYPTKEALLDRCRRILANTPNGTCVADDDLPFLFDLFRHHDEWQSKSESGIAAITTTKTLHGSRGFLLHRHDGTTIDISFHHAVRHVLTARTSALQPQEIRDFREAARYAVRFQVWGFRDKQLETASVCPITGEPLDRANCAVDHEPPRTFERLLFDFCQRHQVNPMKVSIGSYQGMVSVFDDSDLEQSWKAFHKEHARLRLVSRLGNLSIPKVRVNWDDVFASKGVAQC